MIELTKTETERTVMYGFNMRREMLNHTWNTPLSEIIFRNSKKKLLEKPESWAEQIVMVDQDLIKFHQYQFWDYEDGGYSYGFPSNSLKSAISCLKSDNYILIVKEKI